MELEMLVVLELNKKKKALVETLHLVLFVFLFDAEKQIR